MTRSAYSSEQRAEIYKAWRELWAPANPTKAVPTDKQFWIMVEMFDLDPRDFFRDEERDGHAAELEDALGLLAGRLWR